jgi:hypothetical protein
MNDLHVDPVQSTYAGLLRRLVSIGLALLFVMFAIYASGVAPSELPIEDVPAIWSMSAADLADMTGSRSGWSWASSLDNGSTLAFAALVFFPASAILLIIIAGFLYLRQNILPYTLICFLEAAILIVAAAGIIGGAH